MGSKVAKVNAKEIMRRLAEDGYVITEPRSHLAQVVAGATDAFDLAELDARLQAMGATVGRATLFRTVALFSRLGILRRVPVAGGTSRYQQVSNAPTLLFTCTDCGSVFPLTATDVLHAVSAMSGQAAVAVSHVVVYGACADCRKRSPPTKEVASGIGTGRAG